MASELNSTRKGKATFWEPIHVFHRVVSGPLRGDCSDQVLTTTTSFFPLSKSCSFWLCVSLQGLVGLLQGHERTVAVLLPHTPACELTEVYQWLEHSGCGVASSAYCSERTY